MTVKNGWERVVSMLLPEVVVMRTNHRGIGLQNMRVTRRLVI